MRSLITPLSQVEANLLPTKHTFNNYPYNLQKKDVSKMEFN